MLACVKPGNDRIDNPGGAIDDIQRACEELAALIETHLGGTTVVRMVSPDAPSCEL